MRPAAGLDDYAHHPEGRYLCGEHYLCLCESPLLHATFLWGRPGPDETRRFVDALAVEMRPAAVRHQSLVDFSGLTGIDAESFNVLKDFLLSVAKRQEAVTEREAVVRPSGLAGTIVAGYFILFPPSYPTQVFTEAAPALKYLGVSAQQGAAWLALVEQARAVAPALKQLRAALADDVALDLAQAARALNLSARTLQRKLKDLGTSFQAELDRARLALAERLIAETDAKLNAVAAQVGFASYPHFSVWFHQKTGFTAEARRQSAKRLL